MKVKILEALKTGLSNSFNFEIDSENDVIKIKKSKVKPDSLDNWAYGQYQEKYQKLISKEDFQGCLDLYNSGYLNQKQRSIGYKPESKEDLKNLVKNFNSVDFDNFDLNWIDVSEITNMSELFDYFSYFNCNISEWDVSNVTDMRYMLSWCINFNLDLTNWDVINVIEHTDVFTVCAINIKNKPKFKDEE